jgi:ATP-dependent Lhr-like helicase
VLAAARRTDVDEALLRGLFDRDALADDLEASLNLAEMSRRQFREIARVAGLLPPSLPGRAPRSLRSLQASSTLLFDVLAQHDPGHVLLHQARREVLEAQLEFRRLDETLARLAGETIALVPLRWLTPLSFPLWAERMRGNLSSEDWETRVRRAAERLEARYA